MADRFGRASRRTVRRGLVGAHGRGGHGGVGYGDDFGRYGDEVGSERRSSEFDPPVEVQELSVGTDDSGPDGGGDSHPQYGGTAVFEILPFDPLQLPERNDVVAGTSAFGSADDREGSRNEAGELVFVAELVSDGEGERRHVRRVGEGARGSPLGVKVHRARSERTARMLVPVKVIERSVDPGRGHEVVFEFRKRPLFRRFEVRQDVFASGGIVHRE